MKIILIEAEQIFLLMKLFLVEVEQLFLLNKTNNWLKMKKNTYCSNIKILMLNINISL